MRPVKQRSIAVVITNYRHGKYLGEAVSSVMAQTVPANKVVVVDDASGPQEEAVLSSLGHLVEVVRLSRNMGPGAARQAGTDACVCDLVAYLDGDDLWEANKLERQIAFLEEHPDAVAVHTGTSTFNDLGKVATYLHKPMRQEGVRSVLQGEIVPSSLMVRREALEAIGGWSTDRRLIEDWDFEIRLTNGVGPLWFIAEPLTLIRRSGHGNLSSSLLLNLRRQLRTIHRHRGLITSLHGKGVWRAVASRVVGDEIYKAPRIFRPCVWFVSRAIRVGAPSAPVVGRVA